MKKTNHNTVYMNQTARVICALTIVGLMALLPAGLLAADRFWSGGAASYTNASFWTGNVVPGALDNAINDNGTNNPVQINEGDPDWTVGQIRAGNSVGNGAYVQNGQTVTALGTNYNGPVISEFFTPFRLGIVAADTGVYTLNGGNLNYGSGPLDVGEVGTGIMNVNGGTIAGSGLFYVNHGGIAVPNPAVITATAGHGPYLGDYTYYEQGYSTDQPATGLPPAGSTIVSVTQSDHPYTLASSYTANNAVILDAAVPSATITLTTPEVYTGLSFMGSSGNGPVTNNYTVHYASGADDTGTLVIPDWFGSGQEALNVEGRVDGLGLNFQYPGTAGGNPVGNAPYLFSVDIPLVNTDKVVSIDLTYVNGNGNQYATATIMAVSGQTNSSGFTPLAITGYNADVVIEAGAPSPYVAATVTNILNQTAGVINITNRLYVGNFGAGIYNLHGGTNNVTDYFVVGRGGPGTMTMDGGVINKGSANRILIGDNGGVGTLDFSDGTINSVGQFWIGNGAGATGVLTQDAGLINCGSRFVCAGGGGTGTYNLNGGTNIVPDYFVIGNGSGGVGVVNMNGGVINKGSVNRFIVGDGGSAAGTLNFNNGTITSDGEFWIGNGGGSIGTYNMSGSAVLNANNWLMVGHGGNGTLNLTNGTITKTGNGNVRVGDNSTGTLNQFGGAITNTSSLTSIGNNTSGGGTWNLEGGTAILGVLQFCEGGTGAGVLNLDGGLLRVAEVNCGSEGYYGAVFFFNGGTLQAAGNNVNFFHGLGGGVYVGAGGAVIDSQGFDVSISQNLYDGGGGLTKNGSGTLSFSGVNSYSGPTLVNAGTLALTTDTDGYTTGDYTVADGAALGVQVMSLDAQYAMANLSLGSSTGASLNLDLGSFGNPSMAPVEISGQLTINGVCAVNVADGYPVVGQFPLVHYGTTSGAGSIVLGSIPLGVAAYISNNVANSSYDLVITNAYLPRWDGQAGGDWDIGLTTNWVNIPTGLPAYYSEGSVVTFDDNAPGTTAINLVANVHPASVIFNNNSLSYTLGGTNKISGTTGLTVQGTGSVTIQNGLNDYTGVTTVAGGTLNVTNLANGGSPSAIGAASSSPDNLVFAGGTLNYSGPAVSVNRGYSVQGDSAIDTMSDLTLSGMVTAPGTNGFTKLGAAQLTYATVGSNVLSGAGSSGYAVQEGTLLFDGSAGAQTNIVQGSLLSVGGLAGNSTVVMTNTTVMTTSDVGVGNVANTTGTMNLNNNSTLNVGSWFTLGDGADATATFNLNAGTLNVNNGRLFLCSSPGSIATLNINGGVLNKGNNGGNPFVIVDGNWNGAGARTGIVNQVGGTVESASEIWISQTTNGTGIYNFNNGTINLHNWLAVGRQGGLGMMNMNGGVLNKDGNGQLDVGTGGGVGVFTQNGGTINNQNRLYCPEDAGSAGTYILHGGTNNASDYIVIGRGGTGSMVMDGGVINKNSNNRILIGDNGGNGSLNLSGGTINSSAQFWIASSSTSTGAVTQAGGMINCQSRFICAGSGGKGTYDLHGGTNIVSDYFVIGNSSGGRGIVTMDGGVINKGNVNRFIVGDAGTGILNFSGGTITSDGEFWVGNNGGIGTNNVSGSAVLNAHVTLTVGYNNGNGVVNQDGGTINVTGSLLRMGTGTGNSTWNLNGGVVAANEITTGGSGTSVWNFNGGTLRANVNNANFLHGLTAANVLSNGAVIDTGSSAVSIAQALLDGGGNGGLTKLGGGVLYLNGANTYTGPTMVSTGTLGGNGSIAGSMTVASGATLAPGSSIGILTVGGAVNLDSGSTIVMELNKAAGTNDQLVVSGGLTYGGTLVLKNLGGQLAVNDTFTLFPTPGTGSFTVQSITPGQIVTWDTSQLTVNGTVKVASVTTVPVSVTPTVNGSNLTLTWPSDQTGWTLEMQTNSLAVGISTNWVPVAGSTTTNQVTVPINSTIDTTFFRLVF